MPGADCNDGAFTEEVQKSVVALEREATGGTTLSPPQAHDSDDDSDASTSESESELMLNAAADDEPEQDRVMDERTAPKPLDAALAESIRTTVGSTSADDIDVGDLLRDPEPGCTQSRPEERRAFLTRPDTGAAGKPAAKCKMRAMPKDDTFAPPLRAPPRCGFDSQGGGAVGSQATIASVVAKVRTGPAPAPVPEPGSIDGPVLEEDEAIAEAQEREQEQDDELQEVWADVGARTEEMRQKELASAGKAVRAEDDPRFKFITYKEVHDWVYQSPPDRRVLQPLDDEEVGTVKCGCFGRRRARSQVPGLDKKLWASKDVVLCLKMTRFDFNVVHHFRMLRTIYMKLTRSKVCPSIGGHWQDIGFQGGDPCTDLNRSGGVLNVYFLFYFFSHHFELLKAAFLLANSQEQHFPLGCIAINLTQVVVNALLEGKLSSLCNSAGTSVDALETTCKVHSAALYYFSHRWRSQKRTVKDTEKTMNEVRALLNKSPKQLVRELANGEQEHQSKNDPNRWEFTDIEFGGARQAGTQGTAGAGAGAGARLARYGVAEA